jgi:hypothetical protein
MKLTRSQLKRIIKEAYLEVIKPDHRKYDQFFAELQNDLTVNLEEQDVKEADKAIKKLKDLLFRAAH